MESSEAGTSQDEYLPARRTSRTGSVLLHDKSLCIWCMKGQDKKQPQQNTWRLIQTMNAWYAFKAHTVQLEDEEMRSRILALMSSTTDPFAVEIRYHSACWT